MSAGRNELCHCGSGKKYKKCHLQIEEDASRPSSERAKTAHATAERLVKEVSAFAAEKCGAEWAEIVQALSADLAENPSAGALLVSWAMYHLRVKNQRVAERFLAERGADLSAAEREWLMAEQRAQLSVWQIERVESEAGFAVRNLLNGAASYVHDPAASDNVSPGDAVLARVVEHCGLSVFSGVHPRSLPPQLSGEIVQQVLSAFGVTDKVPDARLLAGEADRALLDLWKVAATAYEETLTSKAPTNEGSSEAQLP